MRADNTSSIKLNLTDPCRTVPVPQLRDARPAGWVTNCSISGSTMQRPKTGQEKVQFYCEDDLLFLSSCYLSVDIVESDSEVPLTPQSLTHFYDTSESYSVMSLTQWSWNVSCKEILKNHLDILLKSCHCTNKNILIQKYGTK